MVCEDALIYHFVMKKLLLIISLTFFMGGCGSKGALYLPSGAAQSQELDSNES
nr:lipoprotein [Coxiella endosymbiont of Ornithodoros maritimus]